MAAGGVWMFLRATDWHDKTWGAVGVLFFGLGGAWMLASSVTQDEAWLKSRVSTPSRHKHFFAPPVLLFFGLPWSVKLWFCGPLLVAWAVLFPRYEDRRSLHAACALAGAIAIGQAALVVMAARDTDRSDPWVFAMQLLFATVVLALDARLLWEVRNRLWRPVGAG